MSGALRAMLDVLARELRWDADRGLMLPGHPGGPVAPDRAVPELADHLYARFFCRWSPSGDPRGFDDPSGDAGFVAALEAAAGGACYWEPGWRVSKAGDDWAYVSNGRIHLLVEDRSGLLPPAAGPGDEVHIRVPCARPHWSPGFFYLVGPRGPLDPAARQSKLYVNLAPEGAVPLVAALAAARKLLFEAKVVNAPVAFCRVDTALVYVDPDSLRGMTSLLAALPASCLRDGTPIFTRELGRGIALADAPPAVTEQVRESFGQQRCRLAAEIILEHLRRGVLQDALPALQGLSSSG